MHPVNNFESVPSKEKETKPKLFSCQSDGYRASSPQNLKPNRKLRKNPKISLNLSNLKINSMIYSVLWFCLLRENKFRLGIGLGKTFDLFRKCKCLILLFYML